MTTSDQAQRPRFYEGQYLGSGDLTAAVDYGRLQAARHALGAHTWGIAAGLTLREVKSPAGAGQVDVIIDPGYAWDGFSRPLIVLAPYKIPASLFVGIKYDAKFDAAGTGRLVEIWLSYLEAGTRKPAAGFEVCDTPDQYGRIQETFEVVIGRRMTHLDRHDPVVVAGKSKDAQDALQIFNTSAPQIFDESIPQQTFPETGEHAQWLVPVGYVRWQPALNGPGYFIASNSADAAKNRTFRRYIGVVAENIEAADGAIRLRARTKDPATSVYQIPAEELVDIQGHTLAEGDIRLADGKLDFRAANGTDLGTPLKLQRSGDSGKLSTDLGARQLELMLGPDSQIDNRFEIGPGKADGTLDPKVTVVSNGRVGIGTTEPDRLLTLKGSSGTYLNVKSDDGVHEVLLGADSNGGIVSTMTNHDLLLRAGGNDTKVAIKADGKVGVGTSSPTRKLHVSGDRIRLENSGKTIDLRADGSAVDVQSETSKLYLRSSGPGGKNQIIMNHASTDGEVGIGTETPAQKLHVVGGRIRLENAGKVLDLRADGSAVDLQSGTSKLYLRSSGSGSNNQIIMNPADTEGGVGIGTESPSCKLHVAKSISGDAGFVDSHVAVIENTAGSNGDVLALKVNINKPDSSNNFITFFGHLGAVGSIEGFNTGIANGIAFNSLGADYAEQLPHLDDQETFVPGDLVGIVEGQVTRRTQGAQAVSAVTDRPVVVANSPRSSEARKFEKVTFIGQLPVKVRGPVQAGDYIVPSGENDGVGVAVPAGKLTLDQAGQIVGQAWESSEEKGTRRVLTAIGLAASNTAPWLGMVQTLSGQVEALQAEVKRLKKAH
jgi:hypothetical protein